MKWTPIKNEELKWIAVDFDETIASSSGFPDFIPGDPLHGAVDSLRELNRLGYKIMVYTARHWSDYKNIEEYCTFYGIPIKSIICGKPLLKCFVDDKNIAFSGDWEQALKDILKI